MSEVHTVDNVHDIFDADGNSQFMRRFFLLSVAALAVSGTGFALIDESGPKEAFGTATAIFGAFAGVSFTFALSEYLLKQRTVDEVRSHAREHGIVFDFSRWLRTGRSEF